VFLKKLKVVKIKKKKKYKIELSKLITNLYILSTKVLIVAKTIKKTNILLNAIRLCDKFLLI